MSDNTKEIIRRHTIDEGQSYRQNNDHTRMKDRVTDRTMIIQGQRDKDRQNTTEKTKNRAIRRHKIDGQTAPWP